MSKLLRIASRGIVIAGLLGVAGPAWAGDTASAEPSARAPAFGGVSLLGRHAAETPQLAFHDQAQTARLPMGTIRLRVIDRVGGPTLRQAIKWRVMTYGRDAAGKRHLAAEVQGATPELDLPAAWYIVHAELPDHTRLRHPIEVTAGKIFKYTLVNK